MRKVNVVSRSEVKVEPFIFHDFIQSSENRTEVETRERVKISKKILRRLAKEIGVNYNEEALTNAKKLLEAYLAQRVEV